MRGEGQELPTASRKKLSTCTTSGRDAYLAIAEAEPERCQVVAADRPAGEIAREIAAVVDHLKLQRSAKTKLPEVAK